MLSLCHTSTIVTNFLVRPFSCLHIQEGICCFLFDSLLLEHMNHNILVTKLPSFCGYFLKRDSNSEMTIFLSLYWLFHCGL